MVNLLLLSLETCPDSPAVDTQAAAQLPGPDGQCPSLIGILRAHTLQHPRPHHITTSEAVEESLWSSCESGGEGGVRLCPYPIYRLLFSSGVDEAM